MYPLAAAEFEWKIVQRLFVLHRRRFDRRPPHLVLGLDAVSNFVSYWFNSRYAEGSRGSGVPFCDMYSTQLCVDLFVFHLLVLFGGILLMEHILLVASLLDLFLRFRRSFLMFFLQMYPWHLDLTVAGLVPIPFVGVSECSLLDVLIVLPSYACTVVVNR